MENYQKLFLRERAITFIGGCVRRHRQKKNHNAEADISEPARLDSLMADDKMRCGKVLNFIKKNSRKNPL